MKQHVRYQATVLATAMLVCAHVHAQVSASPADTGQADTSRTAVMLDSVNVTAERRTVDIQKMSSAVSVIGGEQLDAKAIRRIEDLAQSTPALTFSDAGPTQSLNIRGVGLATVTPTTQNGVSIYQDGVTQMTILLANMFYDIEAIEVLRGPQGTLSGNNSTGGAMYIRTVNPEIGRTGGYADIRFGNYHMRGVQAAVDLPAGANLAFRLAANWRERDSYYKNLGPAEVDAGSLNEKSIRLSTLLDTGGFTALAKLERIMRDMGGMAYRPIAGTQYAVGRTDNIRHLAYNTPGFRNEDASKFSLEINRKTSAGTTIRYIGSYADMLFHYLRDSDGTMLANQTNQNKGNSIQYTSELNIISGDEQRFRWLYGLYGQKEEAHQESITRDNAGFPTNSNNYPNKTTFGAFANFEYDLTDSLEMEFGLRYSTAETTAKNGSVRIGAGEPGFPVDGRVVAVREGHASDNGVTGKFALNWALNDDNSVYAAISRGYKAGGYNSEVSFFDPEFVLNYELGWKSTTLKGHLRSQMNVFYSDYKGFQYTILDTSTGTNGVTNLDSGKIQGVEAQFQALFGEYGDFRIDGSFAYIDSEMAPITFVNRRILPPGTTLPQCAPGQDPASALCFDYAPYIQRNNGGCYLFSPELTFNLGMEYEFALANGSGLIPRVNYGYVGKQYTYLAYSDVTDLLPARGLFSALLTLRLPSNTVIELFGSNLTDKAYASGQMGDNEFYGPPREYGLRVKFEF